MARGIILSYDIRMMPVYEELWQHKDWAEILSESNQRAKDQGEIYLALVANENN